MRANAVPETPRGAEPPAARPASRSSCARGADDPREGVEHAVADAVRGQRALLHAVVVARDLLGLGAAGAERLGEVGDHLRAAQLRAVAQARQQRGPLAADAAERAPDLLRDRSRPRGLEALAVERPARRAREVAVDQRRELGAVGALDALEVGERVGLAGAVGLDELLEQVLDDVAHAASSFGPRPSCPLSARRNRDTIWCTLASETPSISCAP